MTPYSSSIRITGCDGLLNSHRQGFPQEVLGQFNFKRNRNKDSKRQDRLFPTFSIFLLEILNIAPQLSCEAILKNSSSQFEKGQV